MAEQDKKPKNIVRDIFERQKSPKEKVSTIFTHSRIASGVSQAKKKNTKERPLSKVLPPAIDIGTSSVKMLQLGQLSGGGLEILRIDKEEYPADRKSQAPACRIEALKKIIARNKISGDVVASVPAKDAQIYNLSFPRMSETELGDAVKWKIAQLKPFSLSIEAVCYDFIALTGPAETGFEQHKVLAVCIPKEKVQKTISLLKETGAKAIAVEIAPISLVNLDGFHKPPLAKDQIVIWLDLGGEESALVISRNGILHFCRPLALTSQHMTQQIAKQCGMPEEEAEKIKRQYGLASWPAPQKPEDVSLKVYHSLIPLMENLAVDIEHSFRYFSYQAAQWKIVKFDRVILSGGGSNLKNLEQFLSARLNVPVEKTSPFLFFEPSDDIINEKKDLAAPSAEFSVSAGLAAGLMIEKIKRLNLMPAQTRRNKEIFVRRLLKRPAAAAGSIATLAIFLVGLPMGRAQFYRWKMASITEEVKGAKIRLSRLQSEQLELAEEKVRLSEKKDKLRQKLRILNEAQRRPDDFSEAFAELACLLPEEIWVSRVLYSQKKLDISGFTSSADSVMQLVKAMKASDKFSAAAFSYTQRDTGSARDVYKFEVTAGIRE